MFSAIFATNFRIALLENISFSLWESRAELLAENDWLVIDNFISDFNLKILQSFLVKKIAENEFRKAGIGASGDFQVNKDIRGDWVYWLDRKRDVEIDPFFDLVEEIKIQLNRLCFLGLAESEFHLAHYPAGTHYARHLDQFNERSNRLISMIFYLNKDWIPAHQGELRIYTDTGFVDIEPLPGRLVIFKSESVEHEVLPTLASRYSLTGWLLRKPSGLGFL